MLLRGDRPRAASGCLWSLLLVAPILHSAVVQTQELGDSGGACAAHVGSAQAECDGDGRPCEDIRGSLLQVNSKTQLQTPETVAVVSEASGPGPKLTHEPVAALRPSVEQIKQLGRGSGAALLALAADIHGSFRLPTMLLVVLVLMIVAVCVMLSNSRSMTDRESRGIGEEGKIGSMRGAAGFSAASLPPTHNYSVRSAPSSSHTIPVGASPAMPGRLPSQQGLPMVASRHLCPGLVVPHGNECILAVPFLPLTASPVRDLATLNVQDLEGKSVIQADVVMPQSARAADSQRALVVLRAGSAPRMGSQLAAPLLAYCKASHDFGARKIMYIYDGRDELFAQISKDFTNRYALTSSRIEQLFFEGDVLNHFVSVTNEQHQIVSETQSAVMSFNPGGSYFKMRVASNVDVGLILCALFSMDFLERC